MEQSNVGAFAADMANHTLHDRCPYRLRIWIRLLRSLWWHLDIEHCVEGVYLEDVVMNRAARRRSRSAIPRSAHTDLTGSIRQFEAVGLALRQTVGGARNVPY